MDFKKKLEVSSKLWQLVGYTQSCAKNANETYKNDEYMQKWFISNQLPEIAKMCEEVAKLFEEATREVNL